MLIKRMALLIALGSCLFSATAAQSAVIIDANEVGSDVVFTFEGKFDTTNLTLFSGFNNFEGVSSSSGIILFAGTGLLDAYEMTDKLPSFGSKSGILGTASGDVFKVSTLSSPSITALGFARGYAGELIKGALTISNQSFVTLGLLAGIYKTTAANGDFVQLNIPAVPVPAALPLLASGLGALGFIGWRRKRKLAEE